MNNTDNYCSINHLVLITGLTGRTIRNYISSGILQGEKVDGVWHFTPDQVNCFVRHPAVRPSILAKQNAAVYDFLLDNNKCASETCLILDIPGKSGKEIADYFCNRISSESFQNCRFSFDGVPAVPRVILSGRTGEVLQLVNGFMREQALTQSVG